MSDTSLLFSPLKKFIEQLDPSTVPNERQVILRPLITYIQGKLNDKSPIRLNFVCTHNSRRSHLGQVWAQALAAYHNIPNFQSYSAGTEATALFPMILKTLETAGFQYSTLSSDDNPVHAIKYGPSEAPIIGFSKTLDTLFNPENDFAAIMTCDHANETCPFIAGAEVRIPITYKDPKAFDHTDQQQAKYAERSLQIATELHYIFSELS